MTRRRALELTPLLVLGCGLLCAGSELARDSYPALDGYLLWLAALIVPCVGFPVMRPITYPGVQARPRLLLGGLLACSLLVWVLWIAGEGPEHCDTYNINRLALFAETLLLVAAVYVRVGWGPLRRAASS